jgi:hypothetical protein
MRQEALQRLALPRLAGADWAVFQGAMKKITNNLRVLPYQRQSWGVYRASYNAY